MSSKAKGTTYKLMTKSKAGGALLLLFVPSAIGGILPAHPKRRMPTITSVSAGNRNLQDAVTAASDGDILELDDGDYTEDRNPCGVLCFGGAMSTSNELTIRAKNRGMAILDGTVGYDIRRVMTVQGNANAKLILEGLVITGGGGQFSSVTRGAGITVNGVDGAVSLDILQCIIHGNEVDKDMGEGWADGGGMYISGGIVTVLDSVFHTNSAGGGPNMGGGIFLSSGSLTAERNEFRNNVNQGIYAEGGTLILRSNIFVDNSVVDSGNAASRGCHLEVTSQVDGTESEMYNNSFLEGTVTCASGIMLRYDAPIEAFRCTALGQWMQEPPLSHFVSGGALEGCANRCLPGNYGSSYHLTAATCTAACTIGHHCPEGSGAPTPCPRNTYMPDMGAATCTVCPAFSSTSGTGATSVQECKCGVGFYSDAVAGSDVSQCVACPEGSTTLTSGATSGSQCVCEEGRYNSVTDDGTVSCPRCRDSIQFSNTEVAGARSVEECACIVGYYKEDVAGTLTCTECDRAVMDCSRPGITVANMPIMRGGWRMSNATSTVYACFNPQACAGSMNASADSTSGRRLSAASASTSGDALCAAGHAGFLCGSCVENWYGYTDSALCTECASTSMGRASLPLIFLVIIVILALVVFCRGGNLTCGVDLTMAMKEGFSETVQERASGAVEKKAVEETLTDDGSRFERAKTRKERASSLGLKVVAKGATFGVKLKILLSTIQILEGIVANFSIPFSSFYIAVVNSLSGVLQIDLPQLVPLDCISKTTYYSRLIVKCGWPLVAYLLLGICAMAFNRVNMAHQATQCVNGIFFIMFIIYPSISTSVLSMFYCVPLEDGTSWLRVDLSRQCTDTSGAWITDYSVMIIVTVVMIVVHVIGTPATYIYLCFWKHHTALEALKEQELQDYYKGQIEKAATYRNNMKVTVTAGEVTQPQIDRKAVLPSYMLSLTGGYKHRTYWYEIFEVLRKVLLVGVPSTFADRGGEMQLFWALLVCFASFGTYMTYSPFTDETDNKLAVLSQMAIFLTLLASLALRMTPPEQSISSLVSVLIFLVPSYAVALETPLFGKVGIVLIKLRECCPNFKPPKPLDGAGLVPPPAASSSSVAGSASNLHA